MNPVAIVVILAVLFPAALALLRASDRRSRHLDWLVARSQERADRVYEDLCWHVCRRDAFERAMAITIARGDTALLADLGIEFSVARRHLEVVA